ncbi:MAG: SMC family ATPase [Dehalococcoidia bacterium]|nr:SMC family ATPase [Dehalococcoidia bacterium]
MIPVRLRLKNFLSYREPSDPLDFESFQIACLCGENGHGKSALLDAITWALWGRARAKTVDELIHHGQTNMEVEFEFQLADSRYRVIRKRSRAGGQSASALELQLHKGDRFETISGNSIRETEQAIVNLLRLDYETFVNSSFLLQGKADSFTISPPSKRKELLGEILGLTHYDELEQRAKDAAHARRDEVDRLDHRIADIDNELAREPDYFQGRDQAQAEAAQLHAEVERLNEEVLRLQQLRQVLAAAPQRIAELEREIQEETHHQAARERQLRELQARIRGAEELFEQRGEIEEGYARYLAAQQVIADQGARAAHLTALQQRRHQLESTIQQERARLEQQRAQLAGRREQLTAQLEDLDALDKEIARLEGRVQEANERQAVLPQRRQQVQELAERAGQYAAEKSQLRQQMNDLKAQIEALRAMARCVTCGQPVTPEARDEQIGRLEAEGRQLGDRYRSLTGQIAQLRAQREEEERAIASDEAEIQAILSVDGPRLAQLQARRTAAANAAAEIERLNPRLAALERVLAEGGYAEEARAALHQVEEEIRAVAFDAAALQAAREQAAALQPFVQRHEQLRRADEEFGFWQNEAAERQREIAEAARRIVQRQDELEHYRQQAAQLPHLTQQLQTAQQNRNERLQALHQAEARKAYYEQLLQACEQLRLQRADLAAKRAEAAREQGIYEELARAFGKGGVQAMIIGAALPEIERDANELLARMTDGRLSVSLATERETQQGRTVETLLIQISDEFGLRNYELFSGGEAFRVNFALRIALAKLLARRAGARLETLVIDEGFGTQDATGRDRILEAIRSIDREFAKIIVVTHIEELKEAFPTRIEVTKGPEGSSYTVVQR